MATWTFDGPDSPVLTKPEVVAYLRLKSDRALDRLIAAGKFPRGRRTGKRGPVLWTGADVAAYLYMAGRCQEGPVEEDKEDDDGES